MVDFGQNIETCRKVQFAEYDFVLPSICLLISNGTDSYFSFAAKIELSSWATDGVGARDPCGHCDNCVRDASSKEENDFKVEAWQILKVAEELDSVGGNATVAMLANLSRGKGGASVSVSTKGNGRGRGADKKSKQDFDVQQICGGPVGLSGDVSFVPFLRFYHSVYFCLLILPLLT